MCEGGKKCESHETNPCNACIPAIEAREAFISGLVEKASIRLLSREEAFLILQGTLSEMLSSAFDGMERDHALTQEGTVERENSALFIEIAKNLKAEMDGVVDHAMGKAGGVVVRPGFILLRP